MLYMLDSNAVSHLLRNRDGHIGTRFARIDVSNVAISAVVLGELEFGMVLKGSERLRASVETLVSQFAVLNVGPEVAVIYGSLRAALKTSGRMIGPNDLWIAAHALALDAVLVTDNETEFSRVPGLKIENWLRDAADEKV